MEWNGATNGGQWNRASPIKLQSPERPMNDMAINYAGYSTIGGGMYTSPVTAAPMQTYQTVEMQTFQQLVQEVEYVPVQVPVPQMEYVPVQMAPQIEYVHMQMPPPPPAPEPLRERERPERSQPKERAAPPEPKEVPVDRYVQVPVEKVVFKEVPVIIEKLVVNEVRVPVEKVVEQTVYRKIDIPVEIPIEVPVEKIVYRDVNVPVEKIIEQKVQVERIREVPIEKITEKIVTVPVERLLENVVEIPIERIIENIVHIEVPVDRVMEKVVYREPYSPPKQNPRNVGVGLSLERNDNDGQTFVERIVPGFAAESSGRFQIGDTVLAIDGARVDGFSLDAIKHLTIGPEHTLVRFEMLRPGGGRYTAELERKIPAFTNNSNAEAAEVLVEH